MWNTTQDLNNQLDISSKKYSSLHEVQVEYLIEVRCWKDLLLRSESKETLEINWQAYEFQYRKVLDASQTIIHENKIKGVIDNMNIFVDEHRKNHDMYKKSLVAFERSNYDPHQSDREVIGIDRPLVDILENADVAMQNERINVNKQITAKPISQIQKNLIILGLISLFLIWAPKW
jgi:hypothetical protein